MGKLDNFMSNIIVITNYLKSDLIKKQRAFKIGLISIFMVVFFLTLLFNAIQLIPSIFIKLTEQQSSEIDLILTPYLTSQNVETKKSAFDTFIYDKSAFPIPNITNFDLTNIQFLNFYDVKEKLSNLSFIEGVAPRWIITGKSTNYNVKKKINSTFSSNIFILNSQIENDIGIGRGLKLPELKANECYISTTLGNALKMEVGETIQLEIKFMDLIRAYSGGWDEDYFSPDDDDEPQKSQNNIQNVENNNKNFELNKNFLLENNGEYITNNDDDKNVANSFTDMIDDNINKKIDLNGINEIIKPIINFVKNNQLPDFSIKKSELIKKIKTNLILIDLLFNISSTKIYKEISNIVNNETLFDEILLNNTIISHLVIYNQTSDLISLNIENINILLVNLISNITEDELMNIIDIARAFIGDSYENLTKYLNFKLNLTVKEKISATTGKWPSVSGNVVAMDSRHINDYLHINAERIIDEILEDINMKDFKIVIMAIVNNVIKKFDINNYTLTINAIFKDKLEIYKKDTTEMRHYISDIGAEITTLLGLNYQVNIEAPVFLVISELNYVKIFLQDIFIGIMFFLWMLCVLLVYSLMLGNVDERTYEFGMLRSLGFKKNNLIFLILLQGLIFAIPGTILGLVTSYIANNFVAYLFSWNSSLVMPFFLSKSNIIFGISAGLSIPLISSYFPIKKCLDDNLRETLSIFNKKLGDVVVSMIKLENLGLSPSTLLSSLTLIVIGLLTYYVAPLSFLLLNVSLFLFIMIGILITMLLGIIILTQLLVPYLQKFILKIIMFLSCKDRKLHLIVVKNLEGHKRRDQQVSIMFIVALGFVIFAGCTLNLVIDFVESLAKGLIGGDFQILLLERNSPNVTFNEISINNYLKNIEKNYPDLIQNYSYISWSANDLLANRRVSLISRIAALSGYPIRRRDLIAIDQNFLESTYDILYRVSDYDKTLNYSNLKNGEVDIIKMLYENPNIPYLLKETNDSFIFPRNENKRVSKILRDFQLNIIASEGIRKTGAIGIENPAQLSYTSDIIHSIPCKIIAMANKLPSVATFSTYNTIAQNSPVFISTTQMKKLIDIESEIYGIDFGNVTNTTVDGVRKKQFFLKYQEGASKELREMIYFAMNNYLGNLLYVPIQLDDVIVISEKIKKIIGYIFLVLGIIALILSFFLIWISFYNNIRENIAEYGIMRSIGITKAQSIRIFLYEAATIILSSIIIGTFIGIVISTSLILQFDTFSELPFVFNFPFTLYFILVIFGLLMGLLGSYYPTYAVNTLSLVKIMKGFNE